MSVRTNFLAVAAVAASLANIGVAASPALAQEQETLVVSYADLNLANQAGRAALDRRIAQAASQLCGQFNPVALSEAELGRACIADTIESVQPQRDAAVSERFGTVQISQSAVGGGGSLRVSRAAN